MDSTGRQERTTRPDRPRPVILDCDPGHDDALAILLALASPSLDVLGITTVTGNSPLANTTRNALRVLTLLGRTEVPVAPGADRHLVRDSWAQVEFHGQSGLDGADLPEPAVGPWPGAAIELTAALVREAADPVTLIATGPLTNIAIFLRAQPALHSRIGGICLMGGSIGGGNTTASAEFNIWADPEAAAIVFGSGLPITMLGLDVTHQALFLPADIARLDALGTRTGSVFADLVRFFAEHHRVRYGWEGPPIHDAVAVAHLVEAGLVETRPYVVDIETRSDLTRGRTVVDLEGLTQRSPNAEVGVALDRDRFVELIVSAVAAFP
jgi:inosine-uridine nucleoside N-ribohydrolase